jgi:hypothetical protein
VQGTLTKLYVHWGRVRAASHADAYARAVLVREFIHERRSSWVRRVSLGGGVADRPAAAADQDAVLDLRAAVAALPARQRATLVLRFYCDLTGSGKARSAQAGETAGNRDTCLLGGGTPEGNPAAGRAPRHAAGHRLLGHHHPSTPATLAAIIAGSETPDLAALLTSQDHLSDLSRQPGGEKSPRS